MSSSTTHERFRLRSLDELRAAIETLGLDLKAEEDVSRLAQPVRVAAGKIPNSMGIQPMEGCDATPDGAPDELTFRRYTRFGDGGAGLLWFEACAVVPEGRANPRQLWLHRENRDAFARLLDKSRTAAAKSMGKDHRPFCVLQLTHSGRYSRPENTPAPLIAHHDPILDADRGIPPDYPVVTDDYLETLEDKYVEAARLAFEAGFDAVDIKACHRYLINELLASRAREGDYGGSYENRTRLLKNVIGKISAELGGEKIVTCRLGIHDAHPYPYGWGMDSDDPTAANMEEPGRLVGELREMGLPLINITMGNPYFNPHVNRPYDTPIEGTNIPDENPLAGVARLVALTQEIQKSAPDIAVVGSGYSWLRNLWPNVAAANIRDGAMRIVGLGRQAFAYPGFAKEIIRTGKLALRHTCVTCSACTQIMRDGGSSGCVPFDKDVYGPIYREGRRAAADYVRAQAQRCRDCFDPLCRDGCPAGVDIPGFITAAAEGDVERSYNILRERNLLPETCAYVCASEVQCEGACIEKTYSRNPVPIREIQRYVAREARRRGLAGLSCAPGTGRRIAVIGAGPAGFACAARLLQLGHNVEVFDLQSELGGVAATSIPGGRLQTADFAGEANAALGPHIGDRLVFHAGQGLTDTRDLDAFAAQFDAVFLGLGLSRTATLTETRPKGVEDAIAFLQRSKRQGVRVPDRVAVLGGGNTAMDAATQAVAHGAKDVYLVYRRSFGEMPAWPSEREEALANGVHFLMLTMPVEYVIDQNGKLKGVVIARTALNEPDESGRRRPEIVPGSKSILEVDMALEAIGQRLPPGIEQLLPGVELTGNRLVEIDPNGATSRKGVYAGGDLVNGGATVVQAVAEGMRAAEAIDQFLKGKHERAIPSPYEGEG
ncbi:MAG: FAD-dependent oxidoreductase [Armatimonadota bacterium]|nr:FAD-dependent oxidoreductase [Armatimonadota bacterium]